MDLKPLVTLLAIVNPLAIVPFFIHYTQGFSRKQRQRTVWVAAFSAFAVIATCALIGLQILEFFGISLASFQVGGGLLLLTAALSMPPPSLAGAKVIGAEDAKKLLDGGTPFFDTRVSAEYAEKTIKGAKSLVYREKSAKVADFDATADQFDLSKLPSDKAAPVVFFCNAGECWRSYKASAVAVKAGYSKVNWFRGGMPEWTAKALPTQ